jgi:hypothetical protein
MRFHFHIETRNAVHPDFEGAEFADFDIARAYGVVLIRHFFLAHPSPRLEVLNSAVLRIIGDDGTIEALPFMEAFETHAGHPSVHCQPGNT